ncbi:MAG: rhodanese-like domain-containing protein [Acidocella sp.]|nr:rhodanese-like domain-containing protein [Acidocella sp.]
MHKVAAFYQFLPISDPAGQVDLLRAFCTRLDLRGTVLIAPEGINGTLAGPAAGIDKLATALQDGSIIQPAFEALELKFSTADAAYFDRLKIKFKREIITFGQPASDPLKQVGTYVAAADWNALISDPEVIVLDTRNDFEVSMGAFQGAINPGLTSFSAFADFVEQRLSNRQNTKIAMYCTGGIRCEKASSFMLAKGFAEIYHLRGGILKYLEEIAEAESLWQGECFVFDRRIALGHGLVAHPEAIVPGVPLTNG